MARLNQARQKELEPQRMAHAQKQIEACGYKVQRQDDTALAFEYKGNPIKFFPYSGWASGKGIKDGRGLKNLIRQIRN